MLPLHLAQKLPKPVPFQPEDLGAVVFGYNSEFPWIWTDTGDPEMGQQPLSDDDSDAEAEDSGIGSSIFSSTHSKTRRRDQSSGSNTNFPAHEDYRIGIICALPKELMAVHALLDEEYPKLPLEEGDTNSACVLGQMEGHNVVVVALPDGDHGTNSAATVATNMNRSFRALRFYFVVGIGGGVPSKAHDIRLGDVVVGTRVIQHDFGKALQNATTIKMTADVQVPDTFLRSTIAGIRGDPFLPMNPLDDYITDIVKLRPEYKHPGKENDRLFVTGYVHEGSDNDTCEQCNGPKVMRARPPGIKVHYGLIASGNQLLRNAKLRDDIGREFNVLCFEMEAAGVVKSGQCLAIRGISDYADSHKNDQWREYAAAASAAYAKFFLSRMRTSEIQVRTPSFLDEPKLAQKRAAAFSDHNIHKIKRFRRSP